MLPHCAYRARGEWRGGVYYEIYIDTLFLINFVMDFLVLWTVSKILRQTTTWLRLMLAAGVGALVICVLFIFPLKNLILNSFLTYFLTGVGMVWIGFRPKRIKEGLKQLAMLYIATFLIGGTITALYYYTRVGYYFTMFFNGGIFEQVNFKTLLGISILAFILIKFMTRIIHRLFKVEAQVYPIEIELKGASVYTKGLLDTGNNLYDPITNTPVMIAEFDTVKDCLPIQVKDIFLSGMNRSTDDLYVSIAEYYDYKFRLIPFHSIGKESGILIGLVPDRVSITMEKEKKTLTDVVIAIYHEKLSGDNSYQVLLHPAMIK